MRLIDHRAQTPEENLAMDEVLLINAEKGAIGETIRFWESKEYFVVVGRSGKISEECNSEKCNEKNIKCLRRISGGGTVLQGPGCLNYSVIMSYEKNSSYREINTSYEKILTNIMKEIRRNGIESEFRPISDLAAGRKKFSGNAQARKKRYFLHHGTFLYNFDIKKISEFLRYPPKEPLYREKREHAEFVTNLSMPKQDIMNAILNSFSEKNEQWKPDNEVIEEVKLFSQGKYNSDEWNLMF